MRFLKILEKAWMLAAIAALVVMVVNIFIYLKFDQHVYFPLFCAMFCVLIHFNIRGQRRFKEKLEANEAAEQKSNPRLPDLK